MKSLLLFMFCVIVFNVINAQSDTVFYFKDNKISLKEQDGELKVQVINPKVDSVENLLFEGVYGEDYSSEVSMNFTFSKLLKNGDHLRNLHGLGLFGFAYSTLSTRDLKLNGNENAILRSAMEFNLNLGILQYVIIENLVFGYILVLAIE